MPPLLHPTGGARAAARNRPWLQHDSLDLCLGERLGATAGSGSFGCMLKVLRPSSSGGKPPTTISCPTHLKKDVLWKKKFYRRLGPNLDVLHVMVRPQRQNPDPHSRFREVEALAMLSLANLYFGLSQYISMMFQTFLGQSA